MPSEREIALARVFAQYQRAGIEVVEVEVSRLWRGPILLCAGSLCVPPEHPLASEREIPVGELGWLLTDDWDACRCS